MCGGNSLSWLELFFIKFITLQTCEIIENNKHKRNGKKVIGECLSLQINFSLTIELV